jgi:hypothetical protein
VIEQKITPEALLIAMKDSHSKFGMSGGFVFSDELSVFLGDKNDIRLIQLLTKLYDCSDTMDYRTVARGKEVCSNVYLGLLGGTTPDWIKTSISELAIGGGFTSRIIFVYQNIPGAPNPFPSLSDEERVLSADLCNDLVEISNLKGKFTISPEGLTWYKSWYYDVYSKQGYGSGDAALDGYFGRRHDTLLKVAMCLCASRTSDMVINVEDLRIADVALTQTEGFLPNIVEVILSTEAGSDKNKVMRLIRKYPGIKYSDMLRRISYCMDARRLNEVLNGMASSDTITEVNAEGVRTFYIKE